MINSKLDGSKFSLQGFLGNDKRALRDIISSDIKTLKKHKVSLKRLITVLKKVQLKARKFLGAETEVIKNVIAVDVGARGMVPCPLCSKPFEKGEIVMTSMIDNRKIFMTPLSLHLIEKHSFFQGQGSYYRIDPEEIIHFLRIK